MIQGFEGPLDSQTGGMDDHGRKHVVETERDGSKDEHPNGAELSEEERKNKLVSKIRSSRLSCLGIYILYQH